MAASPATPPPAERLHTPPTPLHGAKFDTWEPYSPRRSVRVQQRQQQNRITKSPSQGRGRSRTPTTTSTPRLRKAELQRQPSHQAPSPPSSPDGQRQAGTGASIASWKHLTQADLFAYDGSADALPTSENMLPTPSKTPRRQRVNCKSTPHKRRERITLDSPQESPSSHRFQVHIDSQDRQPEMEPSENNPFVGPRQRAKRGRPSRDRRNQEEIDMDAAVADGRGQIFMFRGKKILRLYQDGPSSDDEEGPGHRYHDQSSRIRAAAGITAHRPLTRSYLAPRILFADEDHHVEDQIADEEALTDIEEYGLAQLQPEVDQNAEESTPSLAQQERIEPATTPTSDDAASLVPSQTSSKGKKPSPFDSWPRQKPGSASRSVSGTKRPLPGNAEESVGKRTRSNASTSA
ncbi:hypothetical protein CAC42_4183 [Sphaceloma murrayae]|uniref:Uncharacterized protein n=1 Tax=Sphaceloma murrayae TaxID=2082308 RepID=A0A2K1QL83_9PEZI|nr:hypothetical protein CAC42_4183 [Sphaceloma murrayae]